MMPVCHPISSLRYLMTTFSDSVMLQNCEILKHLVCPSHIKGSSISKWPVWLNKSINLLIHLKKLHDKDQSLPIWNCWWLLETWTINRETLRFECPSTDRRNLALRIQRLFFNILSPNAAGSGVLKSVATSDTSPLINRSQIRNFWHSINDKDWDFLFLN